MTRTTPWRVTILGVSALGLAACGPDREPVEQAPPVDTDTEPPKILTLDTALFIPQDTGPDILPDNVPTDYVTLEQTGLWTVSPTSPPHTDVSGQLYLQEWLGELDLLEPIYECDVSYSLSGQAVDPHTCADCDFVFDVEFFVVLGSPAGCHDPDTPQDGDVWQMGFDSGSGTIYRNYFGTDVWLPWYDASQMGADVMFDWTATLAIEVEEEETQ